MKMEELKKCGENARTVLRTIWLKSLLLLSETGGKDGEVGMSLDSVIRCLGINFLLMGYLVCATLIHIAINSSKILRQLEKMNKDKQKGR